MIEDILRRVSVPLPRFVGAALCRRGRHRWSTETRVSKRLAFWCRTCLRCGRFEVQNAGPMGDGNWTTEPFAGIVGKWEREEFNSANNTALLRQADKGAR